MGNSYIVSVFNLLLNKLIIYYKNSGINNIIEKIFDVFKKWSENSLILSIIIKETDDENLWENSFLSKIINLPIKIIMYISSKLTNFLKSLIENSKVIFYIKYGLENIFNFSTRIYGFIILFSIFTESILTMFLSKMYMEGIIIRLMLVAISIFLVLLDRKLIDLYSKSVMEYFVNSIFEIKLEIKTKELDKENIIEVISIILGIVIGILGFVVPIKLLIILLCGVLGCVLVLWKPQIGIYALVALIPFIPTMAAVAIIVFTLISFFINCFINNNFKFVIPIKMFIIIFIGIVVYSSLLSVARFSSLKIAAIYIVFISIYFLIVNYIKDKKQLLNLTSIFIMSGFIVCIIGIYQRFFGTDLAQVWVDANMFEDIKVRVYSTFENPNVLGEYLLLLIPICSAYLFSRKNILAKIFFTIVTLSSLACLIFTYSRGCWIGLLLIMVMFVLFAERKLIILGIIGLFILPFILPQSITNRFLSIGNLQDTSSSYRLFIWLGTLNLLKDFWIYGIGIGTDAFNKIYSHYAYNVIEAPHSHNLYLQIITEMGICGIVAFGLIILFFFQKMFVSYLKTKDKFLFFSIIAIASGIAGYLIQGCFDYVWYNYRVFLIFWMVLGFGMAARNIVFKDGE